MTKETRAQQPTTNAEKVQRTNEAIRETQRSHWTNNEGNMNERKIQIRRRNTHKGRRR